MPNREESRNIRDLNNKVSRIYTRRDFLKKSAAVAALGAFSAFGTSNLIKQIYNSETATGMATASGESQPSHTIKLSTSSGSARYILEATGRIQKESPANNDAVFTNKATGVVRSNDEDRYTLQGELVDFKADQNIEIEVNGEEFSVQEVKKLCENGGLNERFDKGGSSDSGSGECSLDPSAALSVGFEDSNYRNKFSYINNTDNLSLSSNGAFKGSSALQVHFPQGSHYGTSAEYKFSEEGESEPEELYAQYVLKFGENWRANRDGKLPGFGGTYDRAGWGSRPSDGTNGWSARGLWKEGSSPQRTKIGYYVYHADMDGQYGSHWTGDKELENGKWYCIKQHIKLNTPGENDGVLELWVDDEKIFEKTDIRFRDTRDLKIEKYWTNFYYGGSWSAPSDMDVYMDNLVVKKDPI